MPRISGQKGASTSTSSPGAEHIPTAAPSAPVAPAVTSTEPRSQGIWLRVRTFSTNRRDQGGQALGLAVAVEVRMLRLEQILHARAREGLQPGIADVQRTHGAA